MPTNTRRPLAVAATTLVCTGLACNLFAPASTPSPLPPTTSSATPTGEAVMYSPADARRATVQILAEGTFVDPSEGFVANAVGAGSGFVISSDGIVVTNNHVVTGAARLEVWLDGKGYGARVLGASECWDLAVIQMDAKGEDLPYLDLYQGPAVKTGTEVWAAGFPLGDPEFTLTSGIISKAETRANTAWASVDAVFQHDARINPGNSGGPLLNAEGQVVGVNYAVNAVTDQNFAIGMNDALDVIEQMGAGADVDSIGINGQAVLSEDGTLAGIWVSSVKSGSPADVAGIVPGDLITGIEGITVARRGTLEEYCDVLRSHGPDDVLGIEVLRLSTQELLVGQVRGRKLEATYSFAEALRNQIASLPVPADDTPYSGYEAVVDDTGTLRIAVPVEWVERATSPATFDSGTFASIIAAPDLAGFADTGSVPGVWFAGANGRSDAIERLDTALDSVQPQFEAFCGAFLTKEAYDDVKYVGKYVAYQNCGGGSNLLVVMVAASKDRDLGAFVMVAINLLSQRDLEAFQYILNTFDFVGN